MPTTDVQRVPRSALRLGVLLALIVVFLLMNSRPASAGCEGDPPTPSHPYGLLGIRQMGSPDWSTIPAVAPNPFTDPNARLVVVYGYGYQWGTYDLGCGADIVRDPTAVMFTKIADLGWVFPTIAAALVSASRQLASWGPFDFLDSLLATIQESVRTTLWQTWFPISLLLVGLTVLFKARRASYAATAQILGWVTLVIAVSAAFMQYPTKIDHALGDGMTKAVHTAASPFGSSDAEEQLSREVLYPQWLEGELGTSTSPTATKYGPALLWSTHYTWSEEKQVRADPSSKVRIDRAKSAKFVETARQVKATDPGAYANLTGHNSDYRLVAVTLAGVFAWALGLFAIIGFLLLALAQLMIRVFVLAFPIAGIIGIHPRGQFVLMRLWGLFTAAVLNAIKFGIATAVFAVAASGTLHAPINGFAKVAALMLLTVLALMVSHPLRAMKTMIPGADPYHSYVMGGMKRAASFALTKQAVSSGVKDAEEDKDSDQTVTVQAGSRPERAEEQTMPPLPAPPTPTRPPLGVTAASTGGARALPVGSTVFAPEPAHAPASEPLSLVVSAAPTPHPPIAVGPAGSTTVTPSAGAPEQGSAHAPAGSPSPGSTHAPVTLPPADLSTPIYQSRVDGRLPEPTDVSHGELPLADTQVDADGHEVHVIYHREDADARQS